MSGPFSKFGNLVGVQNLLISCILASADENKSDGSHTKNKNHPNAKPLSFWESREMFLKGHDKSEAKIYIVLIAIFGLILTITLICIALICWKETMRNKED